MLKQKARIIDIFSSIQGEGIFLGAKQIFVRFAGCNMNCVFCDEEKNAEGKKYTPLELMTEVKFLELNKGGHHSVSLTGGEPLMQPEFLRVFLKLLKKEGFKTYLETNGTLPQELDKIVDSVDIIAMDFKLPSSTAERPYWDEHLEFLKIAMKTKVFVKAIVTQYTAADDIVKVAELVRSVNPKIPLILQPATPVKGIEGSVDTKTLFGFLDTVSKTNLENVRVIPQAHKALNVK